jgi:hypothetical protein
MKNVLFGMLVIGIFFLGASAALSSVKFSDVGQYLTWDWSYGSMPGFNSAPPDACSVYISYVTPPAMPQLISYNGGGLGESQIRQYCHDRCWFTAHYLLCLQLPGDSFDGLEYFYNCNRDCLAGWGLRP